MGAKDFLFIGHRASGKTTLGRSLAERGWNVVDVDQILEAQYGSSCSKMLSMDARSFRRNESTCVHELVSDDHGSARIIVCGAGLEHIPTSALTVWIYRDGWEESARIDRERLRPELSWEEELSWMISSREANYARAADIKIHIPRQRRLDRTVDELEDLLTWVDRPSRLFQHKTFAILSSDEQLSRAEARVRRLGLAGIEVRSDLAPNAQPVSPYVASLRHSEPAWLLNHPNAIAFDIDLEFFELVLSSAVFDVLHARRLILSSHSDSMASVDELKTARLKLPAHWMEHAELKFAPSCQLDHLTPRPDVQTFLPQGESNAWFRLLTWHSNALNFLPLGIKESRGGVKLQTPLDLQDWIPSLGTDHTTKFDALLGFPVEQSQGDWWHRRASLLEGQARGYVKIPCPEEEFQSLVAILPGLGVVNLSVTSPLKSEAARYHSDLSAVNTLKWVEDHWVATDTDEEGMRAVLNGEFLQGQEKTAIILGSGDVCDALVRALAAAGWTWQQVRGRSHDPIPDTTLLINATGRPISRTYTCRVHLDLHYNAVAPSLAKTHLNGDEFFAAQARAQRRFWFSTLE